MIFFLIISRSVEEIFPSSNFGLINGGITTNDKVSGAKKEYPFLGLDLKTGTSGQ
jgi:hypothetical protein